MIRDYYQVFYGKVAEKTAVINKEQAKNSADGLAYRIPSLLSTRTETKPLSPSATSHRVAATSAEFRL